MAENERLPEVGGEDAGYLFEFKEDGVYLTVYPNDDSGVLFELSDMRQILREYGVIDYDIEELSKIVRVADGLPHRLAEHFEAPLNLDMGIGGVDLSLPPELDDREVMDYKIEFSRDFMTATVKIERKPERRPPTVEEIMKALSERRVTYGIDEEAIERGVKHGSQFVAARGTPPEHGKDAKIIRNFNLGNMGKPKVDKYDRADYKNLNLFILANKGDVLAERVPHTLGEPGTTVFGDTVKAKPGKPKPVPAGKNTEIKDDHLVVASMDGQIIDSGNKISINPRLEIKGDVGVSTGNIEFNGAVEIGGDVREGFAVRATGDINIKGMVSGGTVEGYNVYIKGGVLGMAGGIILAQENVKLTFIENGKIEAGGDVYIEDVSLHSEIRAGRLLSIEGARGLAAGGYLAAGEEINATTVGNNQNVLTKLVVGVNPSLQKKYQALCKDYTISKKKLDQLQKALNTLGKIDISLLPPHRVEQVTQLTRSQFKLAGEIERSERMITEMQEQLSHMQQGTIRISGKMYPGCRVIINSVIKSIQDEYQNFSMTVEEGEIVTGPY